MELWCVLTNAYTYENYKHYMSNEHLLINHHQNLPYSCLPVPSHAQKVTDFFSIISLHFLEFYINGIMQNVLSLSNIFVSVHSSWLSNIAQPFICWWASDFFPSDWLLQIKLQWLLRSPYTKITDVEPRTKVTGQKSPELTKPHSNCCHEIWPTLPSSLTPVLGKISWPIT